MIPGVMEMELAIANYYGWRSHLIVPNVYYGLDFDYELDVLVVRRSGYCIEVEIKQNIHDLRADFKKSKWRNKILGMPGDKIKEFYYCLPSDLIKSCIDMIPERAGLMEFTSHKTYGHGLKIIKNAAINKHARPVTDRERKELGRLAAIRIWDLRKTVISQRNEILDMRKYGLQGEFEYKPTI